MKEFILDKDDWRDYFDTFSKMIADSNRLMEVEVEGLTKVKSLEEKWVPIEGLSYDPKNDAFYVHSRFIDHAVLDPQEITISEENGILTKAKLRDGEGRTHVVTIRKSEASAARPA